MTRGFLISFLALPAAFGAAAVEHPSFSDEDLRFFREEVRPILEENCFKCHGGTDAKGEVKIRSGLQLISRRGIVTGGDHGPAIDPEQPEKSLLLHVLTYEDEDLKMPPRAKLPDETRAVIAEWVKRGAPWTPDDIDFLHEVHEENADITQVNEKTKAFWSYKPLVRPAVPEVPDEGWSRSPIDAFLFDTLAQNNLRPNGPADRRELIRRATFGLTGLPPTLAEVRAFEADRSPDAWEKVVDRLLASPRYGEKWARHWLDLVRYAETNGFERDSEKPFIWRYRDYVIRALNSDKPYDVFLREQLAGDELDDPTADAMIATGYHRLMQWDDEPADRKQHFFDNLDDDVRITTEGLLGMTIGCARCHDHKGDPVSQEDYYSFMAFFRGMTAPGKGKTNIETLDSPDDADRFAAEMARHKEQADRIKAEIERREAALAAQLMRVDPDLKLGRKPGKRNVVLRDALTSKPTFWHFTTDKPPAEWSEVGFRAENAGWKQGPAGFGQKGGPNVKIRTAWTTPDLWLQTTFLLEKIPKVMMLSLHHDEDVELYLNGQPVLARKGHIDSYLTIPGDAKFMGALQTGRNVLAAHVRQTGGGQYFDLALSSASGDSVTFEEALAGAAPEAIDQNLVKQRKSLRDRLERHNREKPTPGIEANVVRESGKRPPELYVHVRGNANVPGEKPMTTRIPEIFGGEELSHRPPANGRDTSGRRTALAEWITRPDNPRTARVMMNRIWQHHFGRGICPTPNDFGYLGERPSHPELLDWLATEFVKQGWSIKKMHKMIMMTQAYRMSSRGQAAGLAKDPANHLLWRFNLRRLSAEEVRDSILAATGELNLKMGGPSVYIDLPEEVLATSSTKAGKWGNSPEEDKVRRSIYVMVKRSLVPPMLADFDLADTDSSCPVRFSSILPTQALALLNSKFVNDEAKAFAASLREEAPDDPKRRIGLALERALSRPADPREFDYSVEFIETMMRDHRLSQDEAFERFALLVFNLNEFMFID